MRLPQMYIDAIEAADDLNEQGKRNIDEVEQL